MASGCGAARLTQLLPRRVGAKALDDLVQSEQFVTRSPSSTPCDPRNSQVRDRTLGESRIDWRVRCRRNVARESAPPKRRYRGAFRALSRLVMIKSSTFNADRNPAWSRTGSFI